MSATDEYAADIRAALHAADRAGGVSYYLIATANVGLDALLARLAAAERRDRSVNAIDTDES